ncbi:uncharacterized protein LOC131165016 isoform X2 [Malania oleifera]|uniref:uncharacterized protein LOC131165016 isoform X2 n=1 Tax=Malania oleifera TaxID=397392 RepID=UPI0025AE69F8|nr:uncharacterized protein LOC131165016 isoform X2 [Malania oleifera]
MAFHVACPITCKRICFCALGFPRQLRGEKARDGFLDEAVRVEEFLRDDWLLRVCRSSTVQVAVPRVAPPPPAPPVSAGDCGEEALLSAQTKRAALQRKAAAALVAAEDYARRFESGDLADPSRELVGEELGQSTVNVMCRLCFNGENEGSERARRMLLCKSCGKKYHRNCLKAWAQHRDLFHWSSWTCPSCRICEVCRRTGDPNKFMFCKRCDGAYHCYCQQPPHKNVSSGPYLCPKHTRCHSCGSTVSGNGLSTRWFLGYTCCDACGRLFVKGNYCPVCLKVYRDSESTPMVCCDVCQRWVHCQCDGISDEKYLQFQVDGNLHYKCATCRGESYQVKDLEDAVRELWRRRDKADQNLIASLRAAAGLPTQEEIFSISPYSDDEENGPITLKNEYGRSLKFSLKGLVDKSPKKCKESGKKSSNKKFVKKKGSQTPLVSQTESHQSFGGQNDARSSGHSLGDDKNDEFLSHRSEGANVLSSPVAVSGSQTDGISMNQLGVSKHKFVDEIVGSNEDRKPRVVKIKNNKPQVLDIAEDTGKRAGNSKTMKGTKLVIHLGARNRNVANSPRSDGSSCQRDQDLTASNGSEDISQLRTSDNIMTDRNDGLAKFGYGSNYGGREGNLIKLGKFRSEASDLDPKFGRGNNADGHDSNPPDNIPVVGTMTDVSALRGGKVSLRKHPEGRLDTSSEGNVDTCNQPSVSQSMPKDSKPLLKLKFKNLSFDNQSSWGSHREEEKSSIKGQRSKRKRPSPYMEKSSIRGDEDVQENSMNEIMDANWVLKKLGKDAIGKRVEVHQLSDNSWHKGVVIDVKEGTSGASTLSVHLDDGRVKTLELGRQGIRFISQKQKRQKV